MNCPNCNTDIEKGQTKCPHCGAAIGSAKKTTPTDDYFFGETDYVPRKKKSPLRLLPLYLRRLSC